MKITVGKVVAGAAIAGGAVLLLGAASEGGIGKVIEDIGNWIGKLFGGGGPEIDSDKLGKLLESRTGQAVAGAGLLGGGYALHRSMHRHEQELRDNQMDAAANVPVEGGFAEQIAMDRAMMRARSAMMAQTPEFAGMQRG